MKYTKENYQEFALDYMEDLMSEDDRNSFRNFLDQNPQIKEEIEDISIVTLPHFEPKFPHKKDLIKPIPTQNKILPIYLRRIAAAILLLLIVSLFWLNRKDRLQDLASAPDETPLLERQEVPRQADQNNEVAAVIAPDEKAQEVQSKPSAGDKPAKKPESKAKQQGWDLVVLNPNPVDSRVNLPAPPDPLEDTARELEIAAGEYEKITPKENVMVVFIDQLTIRPTLDNRPKLSLVREPLLKTEQIAQESHTKLGKLLARANLLPSGLMEEIASGGLRDKIMPESYTDSK
jgi:hypothetical protein